MEHLFYFVYCLCINMFATMMPPFHHGYCFSVSIVANMEYMLYI